jgi:hypothetical protein
LCQDPHNGIMLAGHGNGTVTLWSPNMGNPLVSLLAHRGAVRALAVDDTGHHLVTAGTDAQVKVWDVRTFRPLHAYFSATPAVALDVSQRGLLAVAYGPHVQARMLLATSALHATSARTAKPALTRLRVRCGGCARCGRMRLATRHLRRTSTTWLPAEAPRRHRAASARTMTCWAWVTRAA